MLRPRRSKALPRHFVLAATSDRVVAFKTLATGGEYENVYELWIRPCERSSWPRKAVRLVDRPAGKAATCGTLVFDGVERVPVFRPSSDTDPSTDELLDLLAETEGHLN